MKIALVYNERLPAVRYGGVERVVMNLAKSYTGMGHQVFILAGAGSEIKDYETATYPHDSAPQDLARRLPQDIDFIHLHQPEKVKPSRPHLFTIHGNASPGETFFPNTNFVSRSHAFNHRAKYYVLQGVDVEHFPFEPIKQDYYVFMAKAKWRVKNLKTAVAFANDLGVPLKVIGGTGRNTRNVEYLGMLGDNEGRLQILAGARALLYPTNWDEPCALAPLEAFACGTPVLGSTNGSMVETTLPGTGFVTSQYDEYLSFHEKVAALKPQLCRSIALEKFSSERQARDYFQLIEKILAYGELQQNPRHYNHPETVNYLYKPTLLNRLTFALRGRI
jgi:glycosyltransferase involved in cell wall biosynthesis